MPEYLHEDYTTFALDLVFPNIQTCCAMVVTTTQNTLLGGFHLTTATKPAALARVLSQLKTLLAGSIEGVFLVGNVQGRTACASGLNYAGPLKAAIAAGLGYSLGVKYHDLGAGNPGSAVHAWRDPGRNTLQLSNTPNGSWAPGALVQPAPGMVKIAAFDDLRRQDGSGAYSQVRVMQPPPAGIRSCALNGEAGLSPFTMPTF